MEGLKLRRSKRLIDGKRTGAGTIPNVSSTQSVANTCCNGTIADGSSTQSTCNSHYNFINFFEPITPEVRMRAPDFNPIGSMKRLQSVIEMVYLDDDEDDFEVSMDDLEAGVTWCPYSVSVKREATELARMKNPNESFKLEKEVAEVKLNDLKVLDMKFDHDENEGGCLCNHYASSNAFKLEQQNGWKEPLKSSGTFKPPTTHWSVRRKVPANPIQSIVPEIALRNHISILKPSRTLNTSPKQKRVLHVSSWKAPKLKSNYCIDIKPTKKIKLL